MPLAYKALKASGLDSYRDLISSTSWAESVADCLAPGPAEFVAFLLRITRRSKGVVNKKIVLGFFSKVNCMHTLARLSQHYSVINQAK